MRYRFDLFDVDAARGLLLREQQVVPLTAKAFEALVALIEARGETVEKEALMRRLWPDTTVEEGNLTQQISTLRKALGESPGEHRYIVTMARRGYRFVAPIAVGSKTPAPQQASTVGRTREVAEMQRTFAETSSGRGQLLCVAGEAGIGKTTLTRQFLERIGDRCIALSGRCSERLAPGEAHLPVLEALEHLLRDDTSGSVARLLEQRAPSWYAQVAPLAGRALVHSSQERQKREIAAFLEELAARSPVVMWLDDIHWADPSTLDLLVYLTIRFERAPILLIGSYRPADLLLGQDAFVQSLRDLRARGRCREVVLGFLTKGDVEQLLAIEFPEHSFPAGLSELLHDRTEGNPLFLHDLIADLKERGAIAAEDDSWTVTLPLSEIARELPLSIRSLLDRTIGRLDPADRQILATGSIQGVEFDSAVVATALDLPAEDVEERLAHLAQVHNIIRPVAAHDDAQASNERYAFVHVLYHEALHRSLVASRKAALSGAVASALSALHPDQPHLAHQLALLFEAGRRPIEAIDQFLAAARQAVAVSASREAASLAQRGLALVAALPPSPAVQSRELQLLITLGVPLAATAGYANPEVERTYTRALELCRQLDDSASMFPVSWGLWVLYHVRADLTRALGAAQQLRDAGERSANRRMICVSNVLFGYTRGHMGELQTALDHLVAAESMFEPADHAAYQSMTALDPRVAGLAQQGRLLALLGFSDRALDRGREAVRVARSLRTPNEIGFALVWLAYVHQILGQPDQVRELTAEALGVAAEHGLADVQGWAAVWHAWAAGDPAESAGIIQYSLEAQRRFGSEIARPHQLALLADVMARAGDHASAMRTIDEALEQAARTGDVFYAPELHKMKARLSKE